ncbi:hypothetical protein WA026_006181 [Henosepilachna vigintioctopunctata]|uniref:Uncharacterized protein n=1 Tax=Henosepilachna vigintioctopunctata TaxID=420089 RepID=A0AAW1THZ6_9CUCU
MFVYMFFLIFSPAITITKADFAYHFKCCSFKCGCSIETTEPNEPIPNSDDPKGFYWRDFYDDIPEDAYPVGEKNQNPQTYIGKVFDPSHNGTFLTTIFEGFNYVYNAFNNTVTKKSTHIQIMCTRSPKKLLWEKITTENVNNFPDYIYVTAGAHPGYVERYKSPLTRSFYIVKTTKSKVTYIGSAGNLTDLLEYATSDGMFQTSDTKMFLLYKKNDDNATTTEKPKGQPFFKHLYKFSLNAGSIIPNFYVEQHVGSCSLVCTNEGLEKKSGHGKKSTKNSVRSSAAMAYYWQPQQIFDKNDALKSFVAYQNETVYAGQGYSQSLNWLDVGLSHGTSVPFVSFFHNQQYISLKAMTFRY